MIRIDTNGLADKCSQCKARAGFERLLKNGSILVRVRCSECCETGEWYSSHFFAAFSWNKQQRGCICIMKKTL